MTVTIYSKPYKSGCFQCDKTKDLFDAAGIEYTFMDITGNDAALEYISEELGYAQAPVVICEIEGSINHWAGLNPPMIAKTIGLELSAHN